MSEIDDFDAVAKTPREIRIRLKAIALQRRVELIEAECGSQLPIILLVQPETAEDESAFRYFSRKIGERKPHLCVVPIDVRELNSVSH